jgi:hypothetical protein
VAKGGVKGSKLWFKLGMTLPGSDSLDKLTPAELIGVVRELIGEVTRLRAENEKISGALTRLKVEYQAVKDELARLKRLPPRPPRKPSGMDKATDRSGPKGGGGEGDKPPTDCSAHRARARDRSRVLVNALKGCPNKHRGKTLLSMPQVAAINRFAKLIVARLREVKTGVVYSACALILTRRKHAKRRWASVGMAIRGQSRNLRSIRGLPLVM